MYEFNLSLKFLSSTSSLSPWLIHPCYRERVIFIIELVGKQMKKKNANTTLFTQRECFT